MRYLVSYAAIVNVDEVVSADSEEAAIQAVKDGKGHVEWMGTDEFRPHPDTEFFAVPDDAYESLDAKQ